MGQSIVKDLRKYFYECSEDLKEAAGGAIPLLRGGVGVCYVSGLTHLRNRAIPTRPLSIGEAGSDIISTKACHAVILKKINN